MTIRASLCIAAAALVLFGCEAAHAPGNEPLKRIAVAVQRVSATTGQSTERVPGNVHPVLVSQLEAKVPARITKIRVKEGDQASEGNVLVDLDDREIQARLAQAVAAQHQAEQDLKRYTQLLPQGAVTKQEFDAIEAKSKIADAALAEAKALVGYAKILAPYDGIVTKKLSQEGDLATPGRAVLSYETKDKFRFEADVPETLSVGVAMGMKFAVSLAGLSEPAEGIVSEISPTTDSNSRTLRVKLDLPRDLAIRSGQFGYVMVPLREDKQIKIPAAAVVEKGQLESVFVVRDGFAYLRLIRTGKRVGGTIDVLSGLSDGEDIVAVGLEKLSDGSPVEVAP